MKELKRFNKGGKRVAFCVDLFLVGFIAGISAVALRQHWKLFFYLQYVGFPIILFRGMFPLPLMLYSAVLKEKGKITEAKKLEHFIGGLYYTEGSVLEED